MLGTCTECLQPCNVELVDFGIGSYEFWGAKSVDKRVEAVSDCCEAPAVDSNNNVITEQNVKDANLPDPW